jgi:hypothetical protein
MGNLSKLFKWSKKVDIRDSSDNIVATVFMRLIGDADFNEAREQALASSKKLRRDLKNPQSLAYTGAFADIEFVDKDDMINNVIISEMNVYRDEATKLFPEKDLPEPPETSDLESQEEYQDKVKTIRDERVKSISEHMDKRFEERRVELEKETLEVLKKDYIRAVINNRANQEFMDTFQDYCVFKATYSDEAMKKPEFSSFDEFVNCAPQVKDQLIRAYLTLEISGEELKN